MPDNNTAPCSAPCLIATALNTVEVQQRELGQLAPGNVRVKTEFSMVSTGTELHTIQGTHTQDRPFPRMTGYIAQGHVAIMYGKPYLTEKGAVANAASSPDYNGYDVEHVPQKELKDHGLEREDIAWVCRVYTKGRDHPITELGVVTQVELTRLREKVIANLKRDKNTQNLTESALEFQADARLRYLPLYVHPGNQARVRAIRRAHTLAVPLKRQEP